MKISIEKLKVSLVYLSIYILSGIEELMESMSTNGMVEKIIVTPKYEVVSGHRRLEAAKRLGWKEVDVEIRDVKDEDLPLLLVTHNQHRIKTATELFNEIKILKEKIGQRKGQRNDLNSTLTNNGKGHSTQEIIANQVGISKGYVHSLEYINNVEPALFKEMDNQNMSIPQAYKLCQRKEKNEAMKAGNPKIQMECNVSDRFQIYQQSSAKMDMIADNSVQLAFGSPPYYMKRRYFSANELGQESTAEEFVNNLAEHLRECYRVLKPTGSFFLNMGDTFVDKDLQMIPSRLIIKLKKHGWILRNDIIWHKKNYKPSNPKDNLTPTYEHIYHLVKSKTYLFKDDVRIPTKSPKKTSMMIHRNENGTISNHVSPQYPMTDDKNIGDFWDNDILTTAAFNKNLDHISKLFDHEAPFPAEIVLIPLLQTTNENDLVLDPFSGSGTTGAVALLHNRRYIGFEVNPNYVENSRLRLSNIKPLDQAA